MDFKVDITFSKEEKTAIKINIPVNIPVKSEKTGASFFKIKEQKVPKSPMATIFFISSILKTKQPFYRIK